MRATVDDLAEAELCYAPQYGAAKDPVNLAGMIAQNARNQDSPLAGWPKSTDPTSRFSTYARVPSGTPAILNARFTFPRPTARPAGRATQRPPHPRPLRGRASCSYRRAHLAPARLRRPQLEWRVDHLAPCRGRCGIGPGLPARIACCAARAHGLGRPARRGISTSVARPAPPGRLCATTLARAGEPVGWAQTCTRPACV